MPHLCHVRTFSGLSNPGNDCFANAASASALEAVISKAMLKSSCVSIAKQYPGFCNWKQRIRGYSEDNAFSIIWNFIKNVVAVAAYSRLASRSQAKFQTMKLSHLSAPCAATPAQSTVSTCRSLRFSPRSCMDVNLTRTVPVAFPRHFSKQETKSVGGCLPRLSVGRRSGRFSTSHLT